MYVRRPEAAPSRKDGTSSGNFRVVTCHLSDGNSAYAVVRVTCPDVQRSFTSGALATVSATALRPVNTWRILRATRESWIIATTLHETSSVFLLRFLALSLCCRMHESTAEQRATLSNLSRTRPLRGQRLFSRTLLLRLTI